jgi:predicted transcriptional regulator
MAKYPLTLPPAAATQETVDNLRAVAEHLDRPVSWVIRTAVDQFCASQLAAD